MRDICGLIKPQLSYARCSAKSSPARSHTPVHAIPFLRGLLHQHRSFEYDVDAEYGISYHIAGAAAAALRQFIALFRRLVSVPTGPRCRGSGLRQNWRPCAHAAGVRAGRAWLVPISCPYDASTAAVGKTRCRHVEVWRAIFHAHQPGCQCAVRVCYCPRPPAQKTWRGVFVVKTVGRWHHRVKIVWAALTKSWGIYTDLRLYQRVRRDANPGEFQMRE